MKHSLLFPPSRECLARSLVVLGALALGVSSSHATLRLWTGNGANAFWSTTANWNPAGPPQDGDDLGFVAGMPKQTSTNDLVGRTFHSFIFNGASSSYTLFGNAVTLSAGVNSLQSPGLASLNFSTVTLSADQEFVADGSQFNVSSDVALNGHTLTLRATSTNSEVSIIGSITGVGDVVKVGVGEGLFGGPNGNTYQGTLYVTEGTLSLGKGNGGNGLAVTGDLVIGDLDNFIFGKVILLRANMIADTATITINHGSFDMNNFDEAVGPVRFYDGGIRTSNATLILTAKVSQPPWPYTRYPFISGNVSLPFDITFDLRAPGDLFISAVVSGVGGIILNGYGVLTLYNTNTFTGAITVNGGMLQVYESTLALGNNPVVTLNGTGLLGLRETTIANKTLTMTSPNTGIVAVYQPCTWTGPINLNFTGQARVTCGDPYNFASLKLSGPIHGTGGIWFGGNGIELTAHNDFTGGIRSACTLLQLNTGAFAGFSGPLEVGGSYDFWGYYYGEFDETGTNANCEVRFQDSAFQFVPQVTMHTNGWANLNGHDNEFGSVDFTGGRISGSGGKLYLDGPVTTHPESVTATIEGLVQLSSFPSVTFNVADSAVDPDLRITAVISDGVPSGIDKEGNGEMILSAANTYRNATTVGGGVLHIQNDAALGTTGAGTTVLNGGTLYNETSAALVEPLTLSGAGRGGTNGALNLGPFAGVQSGIVLTSNVFVRVDSSVGFLTGVISGVGPFTKIGAGTLQLGGGSGANNTYSGDTIVAEGVLVPFKGTGVTTIPGHLIIGTGIGLITPSTTVRHFSGFTINGSVTVNRGGLWDLNGQAEGFSIPALEGRPPVTLNGGGDVQIGAGIVYLPVGGDVVVNPGTLLSPSSFISGNLGLDPGPHRFTVGSGVSVFGSNVELDVPAMISQTSTAADIVKDGFGQMRLSSNNSFTGPVTVNAGTLILSNNFALGTSAAGTTVNTNASLVLDGGGLFINNESLTLNSSNSAALSCNSGSNTWSGPITLGRDTIIAVNPSGGYLQAMNTVSGPGALTKVGTGTLQFWGSTANTYGGLTSVSQGTLEAGRVNLTSIPGNVVIGDNSTSTTTATLRCLREQQFVRTADVTVNSSGLLDLFPFPAVPVPQPTLRRVIGNGRLNLGTGTSLTVSNEISGIFDGFVSGSGALNKRGIATLRFTGDGTGYTGPATVFDGTYKVDGYFPSSPVTVKISSILRGNGVLGDVTVENGGVVQVDPGAPGQLGGVLEMNSANFQNGGVLGLGYFGPNPTGGNDSLLVDNAVTLSSPTISSGFQYPPHEGDVLTLIKKTSAGAVSGAFSGFPEGAAGTIGNIPVVMSYVGGDGNDVTLTVTGLPLQGGGSQIVSGNFGNALVPNDCSQIWLVVTNRGATTVTTLHGTLRSLTDGVVVTMAESSFPNLAPNARGTNAQPFQIRTEPTFPCGSGAQFELVLTASNLPSTAIAYTMLGGSGYGLDFDGGDDRAQARTNTFLSVTNNFTIELWANPTANRAESAEVNFGISVVFHQAQRFAVFPDQSDLSYGFGHVGAGLSIGRNGISVFEQASNYFPSPLVYSNDISGWTHVALVYVNRRPRLYINGTLARTGLLSAAPFIHACASLGGSIHGIGLGNFKGQLDEVRIWNFALSQTQIQTNMNRTLTGTESGLVVYFRCDEGTGTVLSDSAPASPNNSSTLTNGAEFVFPGVVPFPLPGGLSCDSGGGACESCIVVNGQFTTNTPTSATRLYFIGDPSVCYPPKACPDLDPTPDLPPVRNIVHNFTNNTTNEICVTAQLHYDCPAAFFGTLGIAAYLGGFNPTQPCDSYLGDGGAGGPPYPPFSFRVPAGSNFVVVVTARETNLFCDSYALELFGLPCPAPVLSISPEAAPQKVRVHWSTAYPGWAAQSSPSVIGSYSDVPQAPAMVNGRYALTNLPATNNSFFRLHQP